ncbi:hypothetical protein [Streptomyces sp. NPDC006997]|uniref:hypothetical protein n=1 Tax=Streptomyces sp. NPDC006997 TaxID=3155356 RepID=UPI0034097B7B
MAGVTAAYAPGSRRLASAPVSSAMVSVGCGVLLGPPCSASSIWSTTPGGTSPCSAAALADRYGPWHEEAATTGREPRRRPLPRRAVGDASP